MYCDCFCGVCCVDSDVVDVCFEVEVWMIDGVDFVVVVFVVLYIGVVDCEIYVLLKGWVVFVFFVYCFDIEECDVCIVSV